MQNSEEASTVTVSPQHGQEGLETATAGGPRLIASIRCSPSAFTALSGGKDVKILGLLQFQLPP